ncbi:MAG: TolC family protein [Bacteroidales bacterium]|nr:TolC family protein [Bacteroidales bacterium]MCF8455901.1 TolC family protein [Bacteroidales bacterium]
MRTKKNLPSRLVNVHKLKGLLAFFVLALISMPGYAQVWTLQQCIDTAQVHNMNLQIGRNNIAKGEQKQKESKANLIPKVNVVGDYKYFIDLPYQLMPMSTFDPTAPEGQFREAQFGVPHNISAAIQVALPLYNPQIYGGIRATKIASELSGLQYKKTEEEVFFDISNLYYNAQILQHQLAFIDSNIVNTTRLLANMQLLFEQSMAKGADVSKVQLQKEQLSTQFTQAENTLEEVLNALKFLMGIPIGQQIQVEPEIQNRVSTEYQGRPTLDWQLANAQNRILASELNTLKKSRLPSVSLFGSYGQTGFGYDKKPNDFLTFFPSSFAGVQVSYPLFNGTVTQRKINQKKIEIDNSSLQIKLVADRNNMQVVNAKGRLSVARQSIENNQSQINLATTVYDQMILQQKEGVAGLTDVLLADNVLREAQQSYLASVIDYLKADLELKKWTGNISSKK